MRHQSEIICNVCLQKSSENPYAVFVSAHSATEAIDVCTSCMPTIIHGSGAAVKSSAEIADELGL